MSKIEQKEEKTFPQKTFTTKPKLRRLTWHRQQTVRNRVYALQESFYPTKDVRYAAVEARMVNLLGIVDRKSILAYLGRPNYETKQVVDHRKQWNKTGSSTPITHTFYKKLPAKKGYLELFGLGYVYSVKGEWFIHLNHKTQLSLPEIMNGHGKASKQNISPPILTSQHSTRIDAKNELNICRERERRERLVKRERNCETKTNQSFSNRDHNITEKGIPRKVKLVSPETLAKIQRLRYKWMVEDGIISEEEAQRELKEISNGCR